MSLSLALEQLRNIQTELAYLRGINALFFWDQWIGLPPEGGVFRQQMQGYIAEKRTQIFKTAEVQDLARYLNGVPLEEIENPIDRAKVRSFLADYKRSVNVPVEKAREMIALTNQARGAWIDARNQKNYALFKPILKDLFKLSVEIARYIDPERHPLEVMVDASDEGVSLQEINREFIRLRTAVSSLVKKIQESDAQIEDSFLNEQVDPDELLKFIKFLVEKVGYQTGRGGYGQVPHPFTNLFGPKDARITVNCTTYRLGIFGGLHEAGHAMYAYRGNPEVNAANLWGGVQGGFHEAQARFYENMIGKSLAFWQCFYPEAQRRFKVFEQVPLEDYYRAMNIVRPSLNRITADEVTYSLHPLIRFELEQDLIDGQVDFDTLPQAWNDRYEACLGVRPENDSEGLLQDVHWSAGAFGYFQSYTLGNIYSGQIRAALLKAIPEVNEQIAAGNFEPLNNWLTRNIHQYGACYPALEMIRRISGDGLNVDGFINYLYEKYSPIYGL